MCGCRLFPAGCVACSGEGRGGDAVGLEFVEDVCFGEVEAEGFQGDFELVVVDVVVFVEVEEGELSSQN